MIIFAVCLTIMIIMLFAPIRMIFNYKKISGSNDYELIVKVFHLVKINIKKSISKKKPKAKPKVKDDSSGSFLEGVSRVFDLLPHLADAHRYYCVDKLAINLIIGSNDAATTALLVGTSEGTMHALAARILNGVKVKEYHISVLPDFDQRIFCADICCIICINLMNIIRILWRFR